MLVKLFNGEPIVDNDSKDTHPCSRPSANWTEAEALSYAHIPALRVQLQIYRPTAHTHIVNGHVVTRSSIIQYLCKAKRTIFVPEDPSIRKALIVYKLRTPHMHPMPPLGKASLDLKEK
jgi:hypothetical protein